MTLCSSEVRQGREGSNRRRGELSYGERSKEKKEKEEKEKEKREDARGRGVGFRPAGGGLEKMWLAHAQSQRVGRGGSRWTQGGLRIHLPVEVV